MDAHKGVEVERVHVAVPAGESSWLLHGFWTGRAALLCRGLGGNPASMAMGDLRAAVGANRLSVSHLGQEDMEGEAVPLLLPNWEWVTAA